jgi:hypothetical protein
VEVLNLEPPRLVHHNMFGLQPGSGGRRVTARFLKGIEHGWKMTDQKVSLDQVSKKALTDARAADLFGRAGKESQNLVSRSFISPLK